MNTPHPELEQLAAMADADVDTPAAADGSAAGAIDVPGDVLAHVVDCAQCTADLAALRGVRATLRSLPPVSMPDDVAQRLESALRAAASGEQTDGASEHEPIAAAVSVLPAGGARRGGVRRGSSSGLPNFSVAAAVTVFLVIALGVGIGVGLSHNGGAKHSSTTSMAAGAGSIVLASGTDYNQDNIRNQVAGLVLSQVPDAHAAYKGLGTLADSASRAAASAAPSAPVSAPTVTSGGAAAPTASASSTSSASEKTGPTPSLSTRAAFSGPLGDPAQLQACVQALLDQPATPVLVDYAYYAGKPATIIVLKDPADPSTLDVYVEADTADCAKSGDVTFVAFLRNAS